MNSNGQPFPPGSHLIAYLRDSGGRDQDLSVAQQEAQVASWCRENGYLLTRVFKDLARSGTTTAGRDQFLEMFNYLSHGATEAGVLLWEYSRFSRDYDDTMYYLADIRRQGFAVYALMDEIPSGLEGRLLESIIAWKNAKYIEDLSKNVRRGMAYVVTMHHAFPHPDPPRGYRKTTPFEIEKRRDGSSHLVSGLEPDPDLAPLVLKAFRMRAAGASLAEIRQETDLFAHTSAVSRMLTNPIYIGKLKYGGMTIDGFCQPIVDRPTWDRVQEIAEKSKKRQAQFHPRRVSSRYLLSGLVRCARCGGPLVGASAQKRVWHHYYRCVKKPSLVSAETHCDAGGIKVPLLEGRVKEKILELLDKPKVLQDLQAEVERQAAAGGGDHQAALRRAAAALEETKTRLQNIIDAISAAGHSPALIQQLATLEKQKSEQEEKLAALESRTPAMPTVDIVDLASELAETIRAAPPRELQRIFRLVIDQVRAEMRDGDLIGEIDYTLGPVSGRCSL